MFYCQRDWERGGRKEIKAAAHNFVFSVHSRFICLASSGSLWACVCEYISAHVNTAWFLYLLHQAQISACRQACEISLQKGQLINTHSGGTQTSTVTMISDPQRKMAFYFSVPGSSPTPPPHPHFFMDTFKDSFKEKLQGYFLRHTISISQAHNILPSRDYGLLKIMQPVLQSSTKQKLTATNYTPSIHWWDTLPFFSSLLPPGLILGAGISCISFWK